jgi:hypothetical protein
VFSKLPQLAGQPLEPTMDRDDEYRRNAAKAQQSSRRARSDNERANWLRLAEGWLGLLRKRPETDEEALDIKTAAQKKGQDDSESLH